MKKIFNLFIVFVLITSAKAQCPNGNAEQGNFTFWNTQYGLYDTPLNQMAPNSPITKTRVIPIPFSDAPGGVPPMITNNVDYYGGFSVPNEGKYAFRLGNNSTGAESDAMWYKFTVTSSNAHFKFRYAIVLNDGGHPANEQPDFSWFMNVATTRPFPHFPSFFGNNFTNFLDRRLFSSTLTSIVADQANPFFQKSAKQGDVIYKSWQCVEYDLTPYLGMDVLIYFKVRDCAQGGHFGYAYIDGLCDAYPAVASFTLNKTQLCNNGQPLIMDGTASSGEDRYFIEIAESFNATGTSLNNSNVLSGWTYGKQAGLIDLSQWYQDHGGVWKCNTYYKIKLAVYNDCAVWNEQNRMVYYYCPQANAGPDQFKCCNTGNAFIIGSPAVAGNTYSWTSIPAGFTSNLAQPSVSPNVSTTYILNVTDANGCKARDEVDIYIMHAIKVSLNYSPLPDLNCSPYMRPTNCNGTINAIANVIKCKFDDPLEVLDPVWVQKEKNKYTYLWNTGETTATITPRAGVTSYTVKVSNGCYTVSLTINNVVANDYFSQPIPSIAANNALNPNGTTAQQVAKFFEYGPTAPAFGTGPAYHAYRYRLRIFDRWGNQFRTIDECNPNGFVNGQIQWDGRNDNGNLVQQDVYTAQLTLWNCTTSDQGLQGFPILSSSQKFVCDRRKWNWFLFKYECVEGHWETVDTYISSSAFSITVVY